MATDTIRRARSYARQYPNEPASTRLAWARRGEPEPQWHWVGDRSALASHEGFDLVLRVDIDEFDDRDWLGQIIWRDPEPGDIPVTIQRDDAYFRPAISREEHARSLNRMGYSRGEADRLARSYVRQDLRQYLEGEALMLKVIAYRSGIVLGDAVIGGFEVSPDAPYTEVRRHVEVEAQDLVADAIHEAQDALRRLCKE